MDQAGLTHRDPPASAGIKGVCHHHSAKQHLLLELQLLIASLVWNVHVNKYVYVCKVHFALADSGEELL